MNNSKDPNLPQRRAHNSKRDRPNQHEARLREAARRTGFTVLGYEYEIGDPEGRSGRGRQHWFDLAIRAHDQLMLIDIVTYSNPGHDERLADKERYCKREKVPYLIVTGGSVDKMQGIIETWVIQSGLRSRRTPNGRAHN